jgi:hypothetical protein
MFGATALCRAGGAHLRVFDESFEFGVTVA